MSTTPPDEKDDLVTLARARFDGLSKAEEELLKAAPKGEMAWCGPSHDDEDPENAPSKADPGEDNPGWGRDREIRAELIRWLCVDRQAAEKVDPRGIQIHAAKITGKLDLSFATVAFPLGLFRCRLTEKANFSQAHIPAVSLEGSWTLSLAADSIRVTGNVRLCDGFTAEGEVQFAGAQIGGDLTCNGGTFKSHGEKALNAEGVQVSGCVFLRKFTAEGGVRFVGAQIGGDLSCSGGTFKNTGNYSISADRAHVDGGVFLNGDLKAEGIVCLSGAQIGGNLECNGGSFAHLIAEGTSIKGTFVWKEMQNPKVTKLDLINASAAAIVDDKESWPDPKKDGKLWLDGFTYSRFIGRPQDAKGRLDWLSRQGPYSPQKPFTPQPYRQLANVLHDTGDERGAHEVLYEMEKLRRQQGKPRRYQRFWSWLLRYTIGYGHKTQWVLWWLLGLTVIGFVLSSLGYLAGTVVPSQKDAFAIFNKAGATPAYYPQFNAAVFSLEHSFPFVDLGERGHWAPAPGGSWRTPVIEWPAFQWMRDFNVRGVHPFRLNAPGVLRLWLWFQIAAGWILATLFVAGLTGIVKSK